MKYRLPIFIFIAIAIIFILSRTVSLSTLEDQLTSFPKSQLVLLCLLSIGISVLKSWRFFLLLRKSDISVSFWQIVKVYIAGQATAPLPGGEAFRSVLLHQETGVDRVKTSGPVIMQAFLVFVSSAVIAIIGSLYYGILINIALLSVIILLVVLYILGNKNHLDALLTKLQKFQKFRKHSEMAKTIHTNIRHNMIHRGSDKLPSVTFLYTIGIGILSNIVGGGIIYIIAHAYAVNITLLLSIYIYAMSVIIAALSGIVPAGIGLTEGGITGLLLLLHITVSKAFLIVIMYRIINLVFYLLIGIVFLLLFYSKNLLALSRGK